MLLAIHTRETFFFLRCLCYTKANVLDFTNVLFSLVLYSQMYIPM